MTDRLTDDDLVSQLVQSDSTSPGVAQRAETVLVVKEELKKIADHLRCAPPANPYSTEPELQQVLRTMRPEELRARSESSPTIALDRLDASGETSPLGILGQYQLLERLGSGGMGTVYKALHMKLKRPVALKVLQAGQLRSADAVGRFEREMHAVGMLQHPNIVGALDAGEIQGTHYLVMELVDGQDLASIVKSHGPLSIADACELTRQVAVGLHHIAVHGLVHRDIKPSNLMLARSSTAQGLPCVKILDLGLALLSADHAEAVNELTATGQLMGTIDYMAPEQGHDTHTVDIRADLYSLGATLYKLLTGKAPFDDAEHNTVMKRMLALDREIPKPISMFRQDCPAELQALVARLLAKSPGDRPSTAQELANCLEQFTATADLGQLIGDEPMTADPSGQTRKELEHGSNHLPPPTRSLVSPPQDGPRKEPSSVKRKSRIILGALLVMVTALGFLASVFQHAVILIATGQGELTIESDDPDVEVTITQNDVVIFQKSKQRKFRVKPVGGMVQFFDPESGLESLSKKFELKRPGQQARVTVTAAELTKVDKPKAASVTEMSSRSVPAAVPIPSPKPGLADKPKPFAIVRSGQFIKDYAYCPINLPEYQDGDVIEVRGNGPFRLPKIHPSPDRGFDLRAAEGYNPVFLPADDVQPDVIWILVQHGRLRLEGCEFRRMAQSRTILYAEVDSCEIVNCTLVTGYADLASLAWIDSPEIMISDCFLSTGTGGRVPLLFQNRARNITIRNSLYQTMSSGFIAMPRPDAARTLRLENNTFFGSGCRLLDGDLFLPAPQNQEPVATSPVELMLDRNCFIGHTFVELSIGDRLEQFKAAISWKAKDNLAIAYSNRHQVENLKELENVVGVERIGISSPSELQLRLQQGWSPQANWAQWMDTIRGSISRSLPKDAITIGPDWSLIGPGEAYLRTLDPSEQNRATEDALEGGPFTLVHANSPARGFINLSDAVAAAQDGDTIELRTDEAVTVTLNANVPGRQLNFRAAPGYQPKYVDTSKLQFGPGHNWSLCNLILHGPLHTYPVGGITRLQNCLFDAPVPASLYGMHLALNASPVPAIEIINCLVPNETIFRFTANRRVIIQNSVMQSFGFIFDGEKDSENVDDHWHCTLDRSVFWQPECLKNLLESGQKLPIVISARQCVFDAQTLAMGQPRLKLTWTGDHNLFRFWDLSYFPGCGPTLHDLTQWQKDWNSDQHSLSSPSVYFDPPQWQVLLKDGTPAPAGVDFSKFRRPIAMQ